MVNWRWYIYSRLAALCETVAVILFKPKVRHKVSDVSSIIFGNRLLELISLTVPNGSCNGSAIFARPMTLSPHTLYRAAPFYPKFSLYHGRSGPHVIHHFLDPSDLSPQTASRSPPPLFHNTRSLPTDGQTDRQNHDGTRPVIIGRLRYI